LLETLKDIGGMVVIRGWDIGEGEEAIADPEVTSLLNIDRCSSKLLFRLSGSFPWIINKIT
jgi:hypothetical protein